MFVERHLSGAHRKAGWIEVVCGSMFSGKTEELIRRVNRAVIAQQHVVIFKPHIDVRYDAVKVVSHNANEVVSIPVESAEELLQKALASEAGVIAIDEAQFLDPYLLQACTILANQGRRVIVCGLDMDFEGKPFGVMPAMLGIAEFVTKLHAICVQCGDVANYSFRKSPSKEQVLLGEKDQYEARCRGCFLEGYATETIEASSKTCNHS